MLQFCKLFWGLHVFWMFGLCWGIVVHGEGVPCSDSDAGIPKLWSGVWRPQHLPSLRLPSHVCSHSGGWPYWRVWGLRRFELRLLDTYFDTCAEVFFNSSQCSRQWRRLDLLHNILWRIQLVFVSCSQCWLLVDDRVQGFSGVGSVDAKDKCGNLLLNRRNLCALCFALPAPEAQHCFESASSWWRALIV